MQTVTPLFINVIRCVSTFLFSAVAAVALASCGGSNSDALLSPIFTQALLRVDAEPAGKNCAEGGTRISSGRDTNNNGKLDDAEIVTRQYVCSGVQGASGPSGSNSLVSVTVEPAGSNCANAGSKVSVGVDLNNNGKLDPNEVQSTAYVCSGTAGATGTAGQTGSSGSNGLSTLLKLYAEVPGANCAYGGTAVSAGLDLNRDGVLSANEVTSTSYICNGPPGPGVTWVDVTAAAITAVPNTGYLADSATQVAVTLPTAPAIGDVVRVTGVGTGGWKLLQNPGQWIATSGLPGNVGPGNDWKPVAPNLSWGSAAVAKDGRHMAATAYNFGIGDGQIYTSSDAGLNWTARDIPRNWLYVALSSDGSRLVAAVRNGPLYISTDFGLNWISTTTPSQNWNSVASSADGKVLAGVANGGLIYISRDFGLTWNPTASSQQWKGIAISGDGTHLYATGLFIPIYVSVDGGTTWTPHGPVLDGHQIAISAEGRQVATAGYQNQIFVSSDYGITWTGHEAARPWFGVASSDDGSVLIAGDYGGAIYVSTDNGQTWRAQGPIRNWVTFGCSADCNIVLGSAETSQLFVSNGISKTTTGTSGSLSGQQGAAIELQYAGGGRFNVLSNNTPTGGFRVQ